MGLIKLSIIILTLRVNILGNNCTPNPTKGMESTYGPLVNCTIDLSSSKIVGIQIIHTSN